MIKTDRIIAALLVLAAFVPAEVWAQSTLGSQRLGRGYWHMFIAYAVLWLLVGGWLFQIVRRLARLEGRFHEGGEDSDA